MNYEIFDVETTTRNKGDPYDKENSVVFWGYRTSDSDVVCSRTPRSFDVGRTLVGFNLKFDLTWAKRYGILLDNLKVWDCQLAHFLLTGQSNPYPSLNGVSEVLGLPKKLDEVKQYWASGIDTRDIPPDILTDYLKQDLLVTELVFKRQLDAFEKNPQLYKLFQLQCEDLLTLLEMEWNGLEVDVVGCKQKEQETEEQLKEIDKTLNDLFEDKPINFNSNDHISCILFGGTILHEVKVPIGVYKSGQKAGQTRNKVVTYSYEFPRIVDPPKGSELKKEGYFSTDEDTLRNLTGGKEVKRLVDLLLTRSRLEKLRGTYFVGIPEQLQRSNSFDGRLHGQFNQVVARTGRLSSSAPNLQNFTDSIKQLLPSRYS